MGDDSILLDAFALVGGDRSDVYGPPEEDYARVAELVSVGLENDVTAADAVYQMLCVKLARIGYGITNGFPSEAMRDSVVDLAGYAECLWRVLVTNECPPTDEDDEDAET